MTDISGIEISDVLGLSKPLLKLIEVASAACGKFYEPLNIKRLADAKAYEIKKISEAVGSTANLASHYADGEVNIANQMPLSLEDRAKSRATFQEIQKQQNVEAVVVNAYKELENESDVSPEPVNKDWILRFFNSIEDISDEDMQILWGKVLAGEIKKPKSCSLRTLQALRNLYKEEALLFQEVCEKSIMLWSTVFVPLDDSNFINKTAIDFTDIVTLQECHLVTTNKLGKVLAQTFEDYNIITMNNNIVLFAKLKKDKSAGTDSSLFGYFFTHTGFELSKILINYPSDIQIITFAKYLQNKYPMLDIFLFKLLSKSNDNVIEYDEGKNLIID